MTKMTKKNVSTGGNINNRIGLDKILSIGYEVESTNLIKLTETLEFRPTYVLYNSDSARKDMDEFKKLGDYEIYDDDDYDDDNNDNDNNDNNEEDKTEYSQLSSKNLGEKPYIEEEITSPASRPASRQSSIQSSICGDINERCEEQSTAKMYKFDNPENKEEPGTEYPDAVFNITNDIAKPKFNKTLNTLCEDLEKVHPEEKFPTEIKDTLYKYKCSEEQKEYDIHFKFREQSKQRCATFTNVEWVVTYYSPPRSNNIIIDTFLNMIKNIVNHIENLRPIPGEVIYKNPTTEVETVVPGKYVLYKKNARLYYLQTDQVEIDKQNSIDNVCSKIQMTFSAKAEDIINIILKITTDNTGYSHDIPESFSHLEDNKNTIIKIQQCVDKLYDNLYYNILAPDEKNKLRNKKIQIKQLKTYMFLILFKLNRFYYFMFYNDLVKTAKKRNYTYLKDLLFFNSRHTNYVLYTEIKEKIKEIFQLQAQADANTKAIQIIKDLFLQPDILSEYLIEEEFKKEEYKDLIDTNTIFSKDTTLDKENDVYGDPTFSLNSYFDFFEDPANNEKNKKQDGITIKYYDWLEYDGHDIFSANMDLKDDIVLLECRFFQDLLKSYFYHIGGETLKEQMTNGACNRLTGKMNTPNINGMSIANFKEIIKIPESNFQGGSNKKHKKSKTKKHKKLRTRKHKKTKRNKNKSKNKSKNNTKRYKN